MKRQWTTLLLLLGIIVIALLLIVAAYSCTGFKQYVADNPEVASDLSDLLTNPPTEVIIYPAGYAVQCTEGQILYSCPAVTHLYAFGFEYSGKFRRVLCDVTAQPEDKPCQNIKRYLLESKPDVVPVAWR